MNHNLDPDELKIPAYLRKKAIVRQSKQKLILTALDRKQAGLSVHSQKPLAATKPVKEKTYSNVTRKTTIRKAKATSFPNTTENIQSNSQVNIQPGKNRFLGDIFRNNTVDEQHKPARGKIQNKLLRSLLPVANNDETQSNDQQLKHQAPTGFVQIPQIGHITAYFEKIQVAVIKLDKPLRIGDIIQITADGMLFQQPVDSMQINRKPVKIGKKGAEIGLKVTHKPLMNGAVYKVQI